MITLNGERGFEKVETWEEILEIPGFKQDLDPKQHVLKEIIGRYMFKDFIACGLSSCHRPHGRGYIVTTKSNYVTNIGNGCGKTHFGVEFKEQAKIFDRGITEHNNRETLTTFMFQIDNHFELIQSLRTKESGADWLYKITRPLMQRGKGCPDSIVTKISEIVRNRSGLITSMCQATEAEAKDEEAIQNKSLGRPYYIEERVGNLVGIEALYPENNIRDIIIKDLKVNLDTLSEVDIDSASFKDLQFWVKWTTDFDVKIKTIKNAIAYGNQLFSKENLAQLLPVAKDANEINEFKQWLSKNT